MSHTVLNPEDEYMENEEAASRPITTNDLYSKLEFDPNESIAVNVFRISQYQKILKAKVDLIERGMKINDKFIEIQTWVFMGTLLTVASVGFALLRRC
jgi:hypothetical protein